MTTELMILMLRFLRVSTCTNTMSQFNATIDLYITLLFGFFRKPVPLCDMICENRLLAHPPTSSNPKQFKSNRKCCISGHFLVTQHVSKIFSIKFFIVFDLSNFDATYQVLTL